MLFVVQSRCSLRAVVPEAESGGWLWWGMGSSDPEIKDRVKRMAQVSNLQDAGKNWVYLLQ